MRPWRALRSVKRPRPGDEPGVPHAHRLARLPLGDLHHVGERERPDLRVALEAGAHARGLRRQEPDRPRRPPSTPRGWRRRPGRPTPRRAARPAPSTPGSAAIAVDGTGATFRPPRRPGRFARIGLTSGLSERAAGLRATEARWRTEQVLARGRGRRAGRWRGSGRRWGPGGRGSGGRRGSPGGRCGGCSGTGSSIRVGNMARVGHASTGARSKAAASSARHSARWARAAR